MLSNYDQRLHLRLISDLDRSVLKEMLCHLMYNLVVSKACRCLNGHPLMERHRCKNGRLVERRKGLLS